MFRARDESVRFRGYRTLLLSGGAPREHVRCATRRGDVHRRIHRTQPEPAIFECAQYYRAVRHSL
jgi:hypothetical protein